MARSFGPILEVTQPREVIKGYPNTVRRTSDVPRLRRPFTRLQAAAPDWAKLLHPTAPDLAEVATGRVAAGQRILLEGRVLDEDGRPVSGAVVELWQANAAGRYDHPADPARAPLDPNFAGHGRVLSDAQGFWAVRTIRPGAYPVPDSGLWWRPAHVHLSVLGPGAAARLVTQMYFPGDPMLEWDRILRSVPDAAARARLVARQVPPHEAAPMQDAERLCFRHDLVLRGREATPVLP